MTRHRGLPGAGDLWHRKAGFKLLLTAPARLQAEAAQASADREPQLGLTAPSAI